MIEREKVDSTFQRIEKSLNLRFKKKGAFYISKDDSEAIKKTLQKQEFQNFFAFASKVGNPVIVQIVLKNPWLINFNMKHKSQFTGKFKNLMNEGDHSLYLGLAETIVNDHIFSTSGFKDFVEGFYFNNIDLSICRDLYSARGIKTSVKKICFLRVLLNSEKSGSHIIRNISKVFEENPDLYKEVKDSNYLNTVVASLSEKEGVAKWLLEHKVSSNADQIWMNAFISLSDDGFAVARKYVEDHDDFDNIKTKHLVRRVFERFLRRSKKDQDEGNNLTKYRNEMTVLYQKIFRTRVLFLEMLNPEKFRDRTLALCLLEQFEAIGISEKFENRVKEIKDGVVNITEKGFQSWQSASEQISASNLDDKATLGYLYFQLNSTKLSLIDELFRNALDNIGIRRVLCYFFAKSINKPEISRYLQNSSMDNGYIGLITEYIDSENINNKASREFLYRSGKHELLNKFTER